MVVFILKCEDKEGGGDIATIPYSTAEGAESELIRLADEIELVNDWLDSDNNREDYEAIGDYIREPRSFYLVDIAHITIEETIVLT